MKDYMKFMAKYFSDGNPKEALNTYAYTVTSVLRRLLEQCNGNFSRDNIMRQANNLKDVEVPTLLPGVRVNTSPTNHAADAAATLGGAGLYSFRQHHRGCKPLN